MSGSKFCNTLLLLQNEKLIKASEAPRIRFHDLRHTPATLLLASGVHPKIVQERLGHADIGMTLNCYSHVTPGMQRGAAEVLDKAIVDAESSGKVDTEDTD